MQGKRLLGLGCAALMAMASNAGATVLTWIGSGTGHTGNWTTASYWTGETPARAPTTGDTAIIGQGTATVNALLAGAPDVIRVDSGATVRFGVANSYNWTLNGGTFSAGAYTVGGTVQLTADSIVTNLIGNPNSPFTFNSTISEDSTPRKLSFNGNLNDNTNVGGTNTYSGGTIVNGQVRALSAGALGTGSVTVNSGARLKLAYSGAYTFGDVTSNGDVQVAAAGGTIKSTRLNLQGGSLSYSPGGNSAGKLDATNVVSISNSVNIVTTGGYYNGPFQVGASITGTGKGVINEAAGTSSSRIQFGSTQQWTGNTDVKGVVEMLSGSSASAWGSTTGGVLPAGLVTVYPTARTSYAYGLLNLINTTVGSNGGLNPETDLALLSSGTIFGALYLGTNVTVHSLTLDGVMWAPGVYTAATLPNWIASQSGAKTLTVVAPEPATLSLLALGGLLLARRRRA